MLRPEPAALPAGIQLGEPFAGGAELVAGEALAARRREVADPRARIGLVVDAVADLDLVAVALAPVDVDRGGHRMPLVEVVEGIEVGLQVTGAAWGGRR